MTIQERINFLREKARWHDQVSRELHASADQLEERARTDLQRKPVERGEAA